MKAGAKVIINTSLVMNSDGMGLIDKVQTLCLLDEGSNLPFRLHPSKYWCSENGELAGNRGTMRLATVTEW